MIKRSLALALLGCAPAFADDIAITNAKLVTLTNKGTIENATVIVRNNEIVKVGSNITIPSDIKHVVDAKHNYVTPGFIGAAVNWGSVEIDAEQSTVDSYSDHSGASTSMQYAVNPDSTRLPLATRFGFTRSIVAPGGGNRLFAGQAATIITDGEELVKETDIAQFVNVENWGKSIAGGTRAALWIELDRAFIDTKHYIKNQRDQYENAGGYSLSLDSLEALTKVLNRDVPLVFDAHRKSDLLQILKFAKKHNIDAVIRGGAEAWRVADQLAAAKVPVILDPYLNLPYSFDQRGARLDNAALLEKAGVKVLITNAEPYTGQVITQAAGLAVAHGMTWEGAISAITTNVVDVFGGEYSAQLKAGEVADLVVWSGDPLELSSIPTTVIIDGELVSLETREEKLAKRYLDVNSKTPLGYRH